MSLSWFVTTLLIPPLFLTALAAFIVHRRSNRSGLEVVGLLLAVALWGFASALEKLAVDLDTKVLISKLQYVGIVAVGPCCVAIALAARKSLPVQRTRLLALLSIPSAATLVAVMTNEWHGQFWSSAHVDTSSGMRILKHGYGPGFWMHVGWSYTLMTFSMALMIAKWARSWAHYRGEAIWVLCGFAVPVVANLVFLTHAGSPANLDLTPAAFAVTAFCLGWPLMFRDGLFDVVRLAKREILDHMSDGALVVDRRDRLIYTNNEAKRALGITAEDICRPIGSALAAHPTLVTVLEATGDLTRELLIDVAGDPRSFDVRITALRDPLGVLVSRLAVLRDVTVSRRAETRIRANEDGLRKVIDLVPHLIYAKDVDGRFLLVNHAAAAALGETPDTIAGRDLADLGFPPAIVDAIQAADRNVMERGQRSDQETIPTPDGSSRVFQTTKIPFTYPSTGAPAVLGISIDITQQLINDEKIRRLAFFDSLTGLPNRPRFLDRLSRALATAERKQTRLSVLFLDLDRFKEINDRLGHATGDKLLQQVSRRLQECVRFDDQLGFASSIDVPDHADSADWKEAISRFAGDEFTILLTRINDGIDGERVAQRILRKLAEPFEIDGECVPIRMSIGIATYPNDAGDVEALMRCADEAMYDAKRSRQGYAFYDPDTNARAARRREIESELRNALDHDGLELQFEPMRNISTGQITGAEAVLRFECDGLGAIEPSEYVKVAESAGMIHELGDWALRNVCRHLVEWRKRGLRVPRIAVDLSIEQLRNPSFSRRLAEILEASGASADDIELQFYESISMANDASSLENLATVDEMGARLSLKNFGAGQSSIRNLRRFGFARVKIDPSFVAELPGSRNQVTLMTGLVETARGLGECVVVAGVETEEQVQLLRSMRCDEIQGPLLGSPLSVGEFARRLRDEKDFEDPQDSDADENR